VEEPVSGARVHDAVTLQVVGLGEPASLSLEVSLPLAPQHSILLVHRSTLGLPDP
jgi:hypothetical protein